MDDQNNRWGGDEIRVCISSPPEKYPHERTNYLRHEYDAGMETDCGIMRIESRYYWLGRIFIRPRTSVIRPGKERITIYLENGISDGYLIRLHKETVAKIKEIGGTAFFSHLVKIPWRERKLRFNSLVQAHLSDFFSYDVLRKLDRIDPRRD